MSSSADAGSGRATRLRYRPEADGIRAVAVLAVLGYHSMFVLSPLDAVARGGFLGVDVFFVLSGDLITALLLNEFDASGHINLGAFFRRRCRRLLPALAVLLIGYGAILATRTSGGAVVRQLATEFAFVSTGADRGPFPQGLSQTWTLIAEWEFYLVWPLVLVQLLRARVSRRTLLTVTLAVAAAVAVVRAATYLPGHDWVLTYHLAWLRFDELLIGSALAIAGPSLRIPPGVRWLAAAGVLAALARAQYADGWLYLGGMSALAIGVAAVVQPSQGSWAGHRILSWSPLVWLGKISYSLYLWSVPALVEVHRNLRTQPHIVQAAVGVGLGLALATASYYLVERRFRAPSRRALVSPAPMGPSPEPVDAG